MNKNANISDLKAIVPPLDLQVKYMPTQQDIEFICETRKEIENILVNKDQRVLTIVGPCSIHDYDTAIAYAKELKLMKDQNTNLYIVMRVYFEKPRSRTGWKGFVYDPDLDNSYDINKGLDLARRLLLELVQMRIPVGCEFLDLISPQYISDLVSWGAIGARTSESQTHRQLASGLSMPIGFKNLTSGDISKAINGIVSAQVPHNFIGIDDCGKVSHIITKGNKSAHLILRGGDNPNYQDTYMPEIAANLEKEQIDTGIIIDCSHGNSQSNYNRQILVAIYVRRLMLLNKYPICGLMIESNIRKGNQKLVDKQALAYGISVTDACIDINTTKSLLSLLNSMKEIKVNSLGEIRKQMREYDVQIYKHLLEDTTPSIKHDVVLTQYMFEKDKLVEEICMGKPNAETLSMLISLRFALSERVAELKFAASKHMHLTRSNDFLKLITDREIEKTNLKMFNHPIYLKLMELSNTIQVEYLERFTQTVKIGYLFGKGTFSHESVTQFYRGNHISYPNIDLLKAALDNKEVDYIHIPTYNSLIGEIIQPESYWEQLGSVDHHIDLSLFSNRPASVGFETLYLEPHIQKESQQYIDKYYPNKKVVQSASSLEGCLQCIKDQEPAATISSKKNSSNFLFTIDDFIVEHNITTFTLYGL